jgi:SnoaL-like domain
MKKTTQHGACRRWVISMTVGISLLGAIQVQTLPVVVAQTPPAQAAGLTALIDRAAIENLFADYYAHIGDSAFEFSRFFTLDGVLEVNGLVAKGAEEIKAMYARAGGGDGAAPAAPDAAAPPPGVSNMQFTNLRIDVNGDRATAELFWSSVASETVISPPRVTEHGRERTELVKQSGRWLIAQRVVTSGGGMPEGLLPSYPRR